MNPFMTEILHNNFGTATDICHPYSDRYWTYDEGTTFIDPYGPIYFDSVNERKFKEFAIMLNPDDSNKHNCKVSATYISNNLSRCIRQVVYKNKHNTTDKIITLVSYATTIDDAIAICTKVYNALQERFNPDREEYHYLANEKENKNE